MFYAEVVEGTFTSFSFFSTVIITLCKDIIFSLITKLKSIGFMKNLPVM